MSEDFISGFLGSNGYNDDDHLVEYQNKLDKAINLIPQRYGEYHLETYLDEFAKCLLLVVNNDESEFRKIILRCIDDDRLDWSMRLFECLANSMEGKTNKIIAIRGLPNSGKSIIAQALALYIEKEGYKFGVYVNDDVDPSGNFWTKNIVIIFNDSSIKRNSRYLKQGKIMIVDEKPKQHGTDSDADKDASNNIVELVRGKQLFFIFCSPKFLNLTVINFYLETDGKNKKNRTNRCIIYNKDGLPLGRVYIPMHPSEELRRKYEKIKFENIDSVLDDGGIVTPKLDKDRLEEESNKVLEEIKKLNKKKGILRDFRLAAKKIGVSGTTDYKDSVVTEAMNKFQQYLDSLPKPVKEEKEVNKSDIKYVHDIDVKAIAEKINDFAIYVYQSLPHENVEQERVALICKYYLEGHTQDQIKERLELDETTYPNISVCIGSINSILQNAQIYQISKLFESWGGLMLGLTLDEIHDPNDQSPDIIDHFGNIFSFKCKNKEGDKKSRSLTFYQTKSCDVGMVPEYNIASENHQPYFLVLLNLHWKYEKRFKIIPVNPYASGNVIVNDDSPSLTFEFFDHKIKLTEVFPQGDE